MGESERGEEGGDRRGSEAGEGLEGAALDERIRPFGECEELGEFVRIGAEAEEPNGVGLEFRIGLRQEVFEEAGVEFGE